MTPSNQVYVIAEAGVNHNGSLEMARELVDVAAEAGADTVKFQTFKAEKIVSQTAPKADYQIGTTGNKESQLEMIKKLELSEDDHRELLDHCRKKKIQFLSTPFDIESLDFLVQKLNISQLKLPSGEITNAPLLYRAAQTGKPIILSTGMSTLGEVETALSVLAFGYTAANNKPSLSSFQKAYQSEKGQKALQNKVRLLHCTSEYPSPFEHVNLKAMDTLLSAFGLPVGFSDHTIGISVSLAAVARGASIIEKHFTLDRNLAGPDHKASLEPQELKEMVKGIREVEQALGSSKKIPAPSEKKNRSVARKSLTAGTYISKGTKFTEKNLTVKRPGTGISPMHYWDWLGKTAKKDFKEDELLKHEK